MAKQETDTIPGFEQSFSAVEIREPAEADPGLSPQKNENNISTVKEKRRTKKLCVEAWLKVVRLWSTAFHKLVGYRVALEDPETARKTDLLMALEFLGVIVASVWSLSFVFLKAWLLFSFSAGSVLFLIALLRQARTGQKTSLNAHCFMAIISLVFLLGTVKSGGLYYLNISTFFIVPPVAILLLGLWGIPWVGLTVLFVSILQYLHYQGVEFPMDIHDGGVEFDAVFTWLMAIATVSGVLLYYESGRRRTSSELREAKERAERGSETKSAFLANMSHEIRTPMNAVIGMTEMLMNSSLDETQREYCQLINKSGEMLLNLINDILDFSKIEAGRLELDSEPFDIRELTEGTIGLMDYQVKTKGLSLKMQIDDDVPRHMIGDPHRIEQILINLLSNAVKFTKEGGINVSICLQQKDDLNSTSKKTKHHLKSNHNRRICEAIEPASTRSSLGEAKGEDCILCFEVEDTGIGISESASEKIFKAFTQEDHSTTRRYGGTGLGLAICARLVDAMGGSIMAKKAPDGGSVFTFTLALETAPEQSETKELHIEKKQSSALREPAQKQIRILLVEDNPINQKVAKLLLENEGCIILVAENGAEALRLLEKEKFDMIFMDCQMPVMDGFEATRRIRSMEKDYSNIPIIAMTAAAFKEDRQHCKSVGMDDFLSKPFKSNDLQNILARTMKATQIIPPLRRPKGQTQE